MKLNLECGESPRNGYLNITSRPLYGKFDTSTEILMGRFDNLNPIVEDNSCDIIVFNKVLNIMPPEVLFKVMSHWRDKLKVGGILKISYIDIRRLSLYMFRGDMDLGQIHNMVFGEDYINRSVLDLKTIQSTFKQMKYHIDVISPESFAVSFEAIKV